MSDWSSFRKEHYGKDFRTIYGEGVIDFGRDGMNAVENGSFRSYDEYLEVQRDSCGKNRRYFEMCYFSGYPASFKGQIQRVSRKDGKVAFRRIMVEGFYFDGTGFVGKEDHVWMDADGFEEYKPEDCVLFHADIYRYMKHGNGKLIDYGLRNPWDISRIESYEVPTDEELIDQQIRQLVCETCRYYDQCYMDFCMANEEEREERFQFLKNLQPGKFTGATVLAAYELEYRMLLQTGGIKLDKNDRNYEAMVKLAKYCAERPVYYTGDVQEALARMMYPEKPRLYIE